MTALKKNATKAVQLDSAVSDENIAVVDQDFVRQFKQSLPDDPVAVTLRLAGLCAHKTQFADERNTLKEIRLSKSKFSKYSHIGRDSRIADLKIKKLLPRGAGYSLLYSISLLTDEQLEVGICDGVIGPGTSRSKVEAFRTGKAMSNTGGEQRRPSENFAVVVAPASFTEMQKKNLSDALLALCEEYGCELTVTVPHTSTRFSDCNAVMSK
jgi:hypothetical protein